MDRPTNLGELVAMLARAMVDEPDAVEVLEVSGVQTTILELKVAKSDVGKVVGKQGRNAQALRIIVSAAATKLRRRAHLEVIEPDSD